MDDLNRMYGILDRNGCTDTARLLAMAIEQMAARLPCFEGLDRQQQAILTRKMIQTVGEMVHGFSR
jgi:hypothetical protein